jgi:hypothetical protein
MLGVDMVRGLCLVEMMANHLPANLLTRGAVETAGFISAAEGSYSFLGSWRVASQCPRYCRRSR